MLSREETARDFVLNYLPKDITALLDIETLVVSKDSFVDKELHELFSDLLYSVDMKGEGSAYVYLLFEHKSFSEPLIGLHILRYMLRIWEQYLNRGEKRPLPPIIPVVVYHGKARWKVGLNFRDLFAPAEPLIRLVPDFEYLLCDLSAYSDEELKGAVTLKVALLVLKHIFYADLKERLPEILGLLRGLVHKRSGLEYLETVLRYVASGSNEVSSEDIVETLKDIFSVPGQCERLMAEVTNQEVTEMQAISPRLGEFLVKVTHSKDIDAAFYRVFSDYLTLKIASLAKTSQGFTKKWEMDFDEFQRNFKDGSLKKDTYAFDTERDFWEWEETETLKGHYETLAEQWT